MRVAVVGAGILGRLVALGLSERRHRVTIYDRAPERSASFVAAGFLSPLSSRSLPEPEIVLLAKESLPLWRSVLDRLRAPVPFSAEGGIVVAHGADQPLLGELARGLRDRVRVEACAADLEPELGRFGPALFLRDEGWIEPRAALAAIEAALVRGGVELRYGVTAEPIPHAVLAGDARDLYDCVIDCRGLGAKADLPRLRGVRGELLVVEAPEVMLRRPIRLLHPRTPLYVVPRSGGRYVLGATHLESEDEGPISVRATLEMLSAACSIHGGFANARVVETAVGLRPAMPDHLPLFTTEVGLVRMNGAYRHGFVIGPALAERACRAVERPQAESACA